MIFYIMRGSYKSTGWPPIYVYERQNDADYRIRMEDNGVALEGADDDNTAVKGTL